MSVTSPPHHSLSADYRESDNDTSAAVQIQLLKLQHDTEIIKYKKIIQQLNVELQQLKQYTTTHEQQHKHSSHYTIKKLKQQIIDLTNHSTTDTSNYQQLKHSYNTLQQKHDELYTNNLLQSSMIQQHTHTIQQRDHTMCELHDKIHQLEQNMKTVEYNALAKQQAIHNDTIQTNKHIELLKQQLHEKSIEYTTAQQNTQQLNEQLLAQRQQLTLRVEQLESEQKQLFNDSVQYHTLLPDHKSSIEKLHSIELEYARLQGTHETVLKQLHTATNKLNDVETQHYNSLQEAQQLTHKSAVLENENKLLSDNKRTLEHSNKKALQSVDTLSRQVAELTTERQKLVLERDDSASSLQHLQHQLSALREENEALALQISQLQAETVQTSELRDDYEQRIGMLTSDIDALKHQLASAQSQYNQANKQLKQLEAEHARQLNDMQQQLNTQAQHNIEHQRKQKSMQLQQLQHTISPKHIIERPIEHIQATSTTGTPSKISPRHSRLLGQAKHVHTMSQNSVLNLSDVQLQAELIEAEVVEDNVQNMKPVELNEHKTNEHIHTQPANVSVQMPAQLELQLNHLMHGLSSLRHDVDQKPERRRKRSIKTDKHNQQSQNVQSIKQFEQQNHRIANGLNVCIV